jgi:hypothetical protein
MILYVYNDGSNVISVVFTSYFLFFTQAYTSQTPLVKLRFAKYLTLYTTFIPSKYLRSLINVPGRLTRFISTVAF